MDSSGLRPFGCRAYALVPKDQRSKLDLHARRCVLLGYEYASKAYTLLDIENRRIFKSRHIVFDEAPGTAPELQRDNTKSIEWEQVMPGIQVPDGDTTIPHQDMASSKTVLSDDDSESVDSAGEPSPACENGEHQPPMTADMGDSSVVIRPESRSARSDTRNHPLTQAEEAPIAQRRGRRNVKPPSRVPQLVMMQRTSPPQLPVDQLRMPNVATIDAPTPSENQNPPESPLTEMSSDAKHGAMDNSIYCQFAALAESAPKAASTPKNLKDAFDGPDATQ